MTAQASEALDVLIVDDDNDLRWSIAKRLQREGWRVEEAPDAAVAMDCLAKRHFDVTVLDVTMPGRSGLELLDEVRGHDVDTQVVMLTGAATVETAVLAMKKGAFDYITKPTSLEALLLAIQKAAEHGRLRKDNQKLQAALERSRPNTEILGDSPQMKELMRLIERAGPSGKPILIQGETGTGKELVARALHACSPIATKPLVTINCAALPESLLESELFGHERGSFTGAVAAKSGLFEVADGGTLFIDEMGEMPGGLQAKLLRVLEDGSMRRVGSVKERRVNVRLLAATNKDLAKETREGRFREDLYYRINVMCLQLPPLRERVGDIPLLVNHFLGPGWTISPEAMKVLEQYSWPGNVRQLINAIERAKILADEREVYLEDFPHEVVRGERDSHPDGMSLAETDDLTSLQRAKIIEVMTEENGNKARAARRLGISRRSLYRALERFEIS
jgi:DNA-binding NtrC family response regulator